MSGVRAIRYLLANDAGVTAVVPATSILAGDLPIKAVLPAISVKQIDSMPVNFVRVAESPKTHVERVQVSVLFKGTQGTPAGAGYPGLKAALALVLAACSGKRGTIDSIAVDSIIPDIEGPDLSDEAISLLSQSRDFLVRWSA